MTNSKPPIRFYFFLRSPYVWLAAEHLASNGIEVDPISVVGFAEGTVFSNPTANPPRLSYIIEDVARQASRMGLTMGPPADVKEWKQVHNVAEYAKRQGKGLGFVQAAGRARWSQNAVLDDPNVMARIVTSLGLDAAAAVSAMQDTALRAEMEQTYKPMIEEDQVFGMPFFTFKDGEKTHRYWGQDRINMMLDDAREMGVL